MAVIHPEHAGLVRQMLLAGKHVLVEKPAVTRVADWDALVALAHARGLLLLEAMKVMCFPAMRALLQRLPLLPPPRELRAAFGSTQPRVGKLFDPALDGGAAWDVGVYPLWLHAALCHRLGLGCPAPEVTLTRAPGEVDLTASFTFDEPFRAELGASIIEDLEREASLSGRGGAWSSRASGGIPSTFAGKGGLPPSSGRRTSICRWRGAACSTRRITSPIACATGCWTPPGCPRP